MNNKTLIALSIGGLLTTPAFADSCQIASGAYVGVAAGGAHLAGNNKLDYDNTVLPGPQDSINHRLSKSSLVAAIFGGYGLKFGNLWGAAEVFYQFDNLQDKNKFRIHTFTHDKVLESNSKGAYGAAIHLGFSPNSNCVAYVIAGVEVRSFKVKFTDENPAADIAPTIDKSYTSTAFAPGLGVRFSLCKNLSLRTEYKYAMYRSKNFNAEKANVAGGQTDTIVVKYSPVVHSFNVGLIYSF